MWLAGYLSQKQILPFRFAPCQDDKLRDVLRTTKTGVRKI
jgi:hypothetical protein